MNSVVAQDIVKFSLFNYDNLIADHYENTNEYISQLAYLLHKGTDLPIESFESILNNEELVSETNPVKYMLMINTKTKFQTGYYFVDD